VKKLPVDGVKIEKFSLDGLGEDPVNDAIVRLVVDFAHTLGLKVTVKGVENDQQVASLMIKRCNLVQGFYYSRPARRGSGEVRSDSSCMGASK
jgi:EAL domain-containing protein (putative c-di-GMP-specific phosphodiesterase class I)